MRVRRLGQSAFHLTASSMNALMDPFDTADLPSRGAPVAVVPRL